MDIQTMTEKEIEKWKDVNPYHRYRVAWDIATGSSGDSPTLVVRDMENGHIVQNIDMYGHNYEEQYNIVAYWSEKYNRALAYSHRQATRLV